MKNLHNIGTLTRNELCILAYIQAGHETHLNWKFTIRNGVLYCKRTGIYDWVPALSTFDLRYPMDVWAKKDFFQPDLSVLIK